MQSYVNRRSILAVASGIGLGLAVASRRSLAGDDRSGQTAGEKSLIAVPKFAASNAHTTEIADRIRQVIIDRFLRLESYALLSDATERATYTYIDRLPEFSRWQSRNVQFLMIAEVSGWDGNLKVTARVWNIPGGKHFYGGQVVDRIEDWQKSADFLAGEISRRLSN